MKQGMKNVKRLLSLIMVFAMFLTMLPPTASAAEDDTITVYFRNDWLWPSVQLHYWDSPTKGGTSWPGIDMEKIDTVSTSDGDRDIYSAEIPADVGGFLFSGTENGNASNRQQTPDIKTGISDGKAYTIHWDGKNAVKEIDYTPKPVIYNVTFKGTNVTSSGAATATVGADYTATLTAVQGYALPESVTVTGADHTYNKDTGVLTIPGDSITGDVTITAAGVKLGTTVYFVNSGSWSKVNAYAWTINPAAAWPGTAMTKTGETVNGFEVYSITFDTAYANIIFNDSSNQTPDLTLEKDKYFDFKSGAWYASLSEVPVPPAATYILAGSEAMFGSNWTPGDTNNRMALVDSLYEKTYTNVPAGSYEFKVTDGTWNNSWGNGSANYKLNLQKKSDVTIRFNAQTKEITVEINPVLATYTVTFNGTNVTSNGAASVTEGETYTATLTAAEGYTLPETITVNGGTSDYNKETGALTITGITGNVTITALGVAIPAEPETVTIYFQNNWLWSDVRVHFWGSENVDDTAWPGIAMIKVDNDGQYDIYSAQIPADVTGLIINGVKDDGSGNRDQTPNITSGIVDGKGYKMAWDNGNKVEDFVYTPAGDAPTYILAGSGMFGTNWDPANTANTMTLNTATGLYEKTYEAVPAGEYEFKVTNGTWDASWGVGSDNYKLTLTEESDVTIRFNAETKAITVETKEPSDSEEDESVYIINFHFANTRGWNPVNLYLWDGASTGSWPGTAITTRDADGYHTYTAESTQKNLSYIFNNGSEQTVDLKVDESFFGEDNTADVYVKLAALSDGKYTATASREPFTDVTLVVSPLIEGTSVTFQYAGTGTSVEVRGTLPGCSWDNGLAMVKNDKGIWTLTIEDLPPAVYEYKFVVDGSTWLADPSNGKTNADGNSVFTITDPNAVDNNIITVNVYYDRADGIYVKKDADGAGVDGVWNAHVWGDVEDGGRRDYQEKDGKMVFTLELPGRSTHNVYLKNRLSTESKDWLQEEGQVSIALDNIVSGTVNVYVTSDGQDGNKGNSTYSIVPGTDIVFANKIVDVQYDYESGKVTVTTLEAMTDTAALGVVNKTDSSEEITVTAVKASNKAYTLTLNKALELATLYQYQVTFDGYNYDIGIDNVYASDKFAEEFTYDGELGSFYTASATTFKLWAPTAEEVSVNLYTSGTAGTEDLIKSVPMTADVNGTWVVTVDGDLNGTYYTYAVTVNGETVEAVDPYARTTGVNGQRAMIIDLDSTDPAGWANDRNPNPVTSQTDAVIYELHVRDFSIDSSSGISAANRGKFLAFTEEGTTVGGAGAIKSGVDYLEELGITHLHLLPIYDYGSVDETKCNTFNWGYDPVNYNVPEGSYSTNPYDGAVRVKEMKQMVQALHNNGISVVMDVVYNHVYDAGKFCFNNIVPGYFSRVNSNTSGCGNDTASEREMVRKYIVESVTYWADEYHIDGFRFDLVGLLDVNTINAIVTEVHKTHPNVIFYGEGWDMDSTNREPGTEMAKQGNASKTPGFAYFSDSMRNGIGGNNGHSTGFASGAANGASLVKEWMANPQWTANPEQVVQYASCHDNYTLADKLILSTNASGVTDNIIKMNNLAAAFYMTSQGVPFIHAGEEFLREKVNESGKRVENSYNASDFVNHLNWNDLETYADNVEYYKGLIAFRAANPALRYATAAQIAENVRSTTAEGNLLVFRVDANGTATTDDEDILVIFNANKGAKTVNLPEGEWTIYINAEDAGTTALGTASGTVSVEGISAMVLTKPDAGKDEKEPLGASEEKTIYFSNNKHWEKVYAYAWTNGDQVLLGQWPGTEMTYVETNDYGEKIFSVTLPASATGIEGVIFNNGSGEQTVDIEPGIDGTGYYCADQVDGKYQVGTYTYRAPNLGSADEYFLVGYINSADYVGGDYPFDENGQIKVTFGADSYVYVINGDNSETYMTDGYQGAVTSATLKDTAKHTLTGEKWDKLLIPGGEEVTITMTVNDNNTVTLSYETAAKAVVDGTGIQDGVTLHCWNWSFAEIEKQIPTIAALGYTAIQTSPVQAMKEDTNLTTNSVGSHWWVYYQPVDFVITTDDGNALGTKAELASMVATAHAYGIQVIVDVVANHLGNKTGNDLADKIPEYLRKDEYWHDITKNISSWDSREDMTQNCLDGLPDLNTANDEIQGYVLDFLKECVDIGVDGFRFDMAKSIETPKDDASFASDFWPTVIGGAEEYADEKYGKDLYMYGEVLDDAKISISAYTEYMAVTDNGWGNHLRSMVAGDQATMVSGYYKSAPASALVIWAESHDTYATSDAGQSSAGVSELDINKTWALVAARSDAMGLYLARPESLSQAIGVASTTGWDNPEVGAVNNFHKAFAGQSETIGNENGISYVERGTTGVVLVNAKGESADVSVSAKAMADGTYTDQITGNIFTVANGKISGKIGNTGIAVVYTPAEYKITKGANGTWTQGSNAGLEFTANGEYSKFTAVSVDGKIVAKSNYTSKSGSTVVTLKESYLDTLTVGEHTLTVNYTDGSTSCKFTIKAAPSTETTEPGGSSTETTEPGGSSTETTAPGGSSTETTAPGGSTTETTKPGSSTTETTKPGATAPGGGSPSTGDDSNIFLWSTLFLLCGAAVAALIATKKRSRKDA